MTLVLWLALGDTLALKEKAAVAGRFVTLLEIVDLDKISMRGREELKYVYLGRAPESGEREITADEIRRELRRRGIEGYEVKGEKTKVAPASSEPTMGEMGREALAFEVKLHLAVTRGMSAADFAVRVTYLDPESIPEGFTVDSIKAVDESDLKRAEYTVSLRKDRVRMTATVIVKVVTVREVAFAVRDLGPNRAIAREDFEIRRVEVDHEDKYVKDVELLIGARTIVKIPKGEPMSILDVKLKPVVRRRDEVTASSRYLTTKARAVEDGAVGDVIWLEFAKTGARFQGKVVSAHEVEIVDGEKK